MKRSIISVCFASVFSLAFIACGDSNTSTVNPTPTSIDTFYSKNNFKTTYDRYEVDTSKADGTKPDSLIVSSKITVSETTTDTNMTFAGKTHVTAILSSNGTSTESLYFWQDPSNYDLYRYNYGVSYINSFPFLVQFIGGPVDIKWVRVIKAGASVGESWIAAKDSVYLATFNTYIYLTNTATMLGDTTIIVASESLKCKHIRIIGIASMAYAGAITITGKNIADTYISSKYGTTVWDYFRSSTVTPSPNDANTARYNFKARGYSKIMRSHS